MPQQNYPPEVVATLNDLLRLEEVAGAQRFFPHQPVYSILAGRHSSKLRGRGLDFEEVRLYIPGDDIRNIDWRVTARTGVTHSKLFNEEKERPVFILLDQSSSMFFGSQRFMKSVSAAHAAAISAFHTLRRGDRVGGIVFSEDQHDYIPPRRNRDSLLFYLQTIARYNCRLPLRTTPQTPSLSSILRITAALAAHDYVITLIGDCSNLDMESKQQLKMLNAHNDIILVHIYDAFERQLPTGKLLLTDGRRQLSWDNRRNKSGDAWRKYFEDTKSNLTEEFATTRIPLVFLNTSETIKHQLRQQLWTQNTTS
jgi:uncharacterized protein (DUF58 family)